MSPLTGSGGVLDDAAGVRSRDVSEHGDPELAHQRSDRLEAPRVVMVAGDHDHLRTRVVQVEERSQHDLLGLRGRRGGLVQVARDKR